MNFGKVDIVACSLPERFAQCAVRVTLIVELQQCKQLLPGFRLILDNVNNVLLGTQSGFWLMILKIVKRIRSSRSEIKFGDQ